MEKLTVRQKEILDFVTQRAEESGRVPTIREIASRFRISIGPVQKHVQALVKKGHVNRQPGVARGIEVLRRKSLAAVPVLGRVPAGVPVPPIEDAGDVTYVERNILKGGQYYALKVTGDSMIGAGIFAGDVIVVRQQPSAEDGEIVVALADGEATVKRLRKKAGAIVLEPANQNYQPVTGKEITVLGKVVHLSRTYEK